MSFNEFPLLTASNFSGNGWQTVEFFASNFTIIDFTIVGIGLFLIFYQCYLFWIPGKFLRTSIFAHSLRVERDYRKKRLELELRIVSSLIELLPVLGIMGTVWGIMSALNYIRTVDTPTINIIAQRLAPALSTTFFGLVFAATNLVLFNFLAPYFEETLYEPEEEAAAPAVAEAPTLTEQASSLTHKTTILNPPPKKQTGAFPYKKPDFAPQEEEPDFLDDDLEPQK